MKNKLLGSILIIAGSSIGGGMLAMPITSAGVGFLGITGLLFTIWFAMCASALLVVRVYDFNTPQDGFDTLTQKYIGTFGNRIAGISLMFLIYGLTAAYMSGGGTILANYLKSGFHINFDDRWAILAFSLLFGGIVSLSTKSVDLFTRILFLIKLIFLFMLVVLLLPYIRGENLLAAPIEKGLILTAIPAIFTSFGFHGSIPSIVSYLEGDKKLLQRAFLFGSLLPLFIYIIWQIVVLGSLDQMRFMHALLQETGLDGLISSIRQMAHRPEVETFFSVFAAAALGTSFLGVSIGLFDYYLDLFKNTARKKRRIKASLLTFIPPLIFAVFYPKGFILALGYAAIAGVILALIIPCFLYYKAMKLHQQKISLPMYLLLGFLLLLAILIIFSQLKIAWQW